MKCTVLIAFVATLLPRGAFSIPVPVSISIEAAESTQSSHGSYVDAAARDDFSTAGRSGYNSVGNIARDATTAADTDGRSGYNSVEVATRAGSTDIETERRSGYNSVKVVERISTTEAETDGRSGYN